MSNPVYLDYLIRPMTAASMQAFSAATISQDLIKATRTPVVEFGIQTATVQAALGDYVTRANASQEVLPTYVDVIILQRTMAAIMAYYGSADMGFVVTEHASDDLNPSFVRIRLDWTPT